jgi:hypothetical protein
MNAAPSGADVDRRLRELDPLDVIIALTTRLALALDKLHALARECAECGGTGETGELYELRTMTDDPRLIDGPMAYGRRSRIARCGSMVSKMVCAAAVLVSPCPACADIRATIRTCEGPSK